MKANFSKETLDEAGQPVRIKYTIKKGDYSRLNNKGVLKVYNGKVPVEIPVTAILGKWKESHSGVTIFKLNEEWQIEGEYAKNPKPVSLITKVRRHFSKYNPFPAFEKFLDRRINEDNLLKDA